jgi:hypothetical protein
MSVTFQKRQKEMKRLEKQRAKAEKRAQKKESRRGAKEADADPSANTPTEPRLQPRQD